jgi:phage head maturation protease
MVQRPKKTDWNPRGIPERTVQEARVMEFGPVTFPAYAGATAGLRSMTDEFLLATLGGR